MNIPTSSILDVALGLALVYYILSLIVSYITSKIAEWTDLRAKDLKVGLESLLNDSGKLDAFMKHPLIANLVPMKSTFLGTKAKQDAKSQLAEIPSRTFALAVLDVVANGQDADDVKKVKSYIEKLPAGATKKALLGLVNSGVKEVSDVRKLMEGWFDDTMAKVAALYKRHARNIAIVVALVVTLVLGVDSVAIAKHLWKEPASRAATAAEVDQAIVQERLAGEDLQMYVSELAGLKLPVFWDLRASVLPDREDTGGWTQFILWKLVGLTTTGVAAAQGSSFWYQVLKGIRAKTGAQQKDAPKEDT